MLINTLKMEVQLDDTEQRKFAAALANPDKKIRERTCKTLQSYAQHYEEMGEERGEGKGGKDKEKGKSSGKGYHKTQSSGWFNKVKLLLESWQDYDSKKVDQRIVQFEKEMSSVWATHARCLLDRYRTDMGSFHAAANRLAQEPLMRDVLQQRADRRAAQEQEDNEQEEEQSRKRHKGKGDR